MDCFIICVPTPVDTSHQPDLSKVKAASETISGFLRKDALVILESTVSPGTVEEIVIPVLEKSGLKAGNDFFLPHCPERINPDNKQWNVKTIPQIVGGLDKISTELSFELYNTILESKVLKLSSLKNVEATKIVENTFRDINIAFVNELARTFDKIGIDVEEVINAAATKPFGFLPHCPGCGVGEHFIAVDPYYLIEKAETKGFNYSFLKLSRQINNDMPHYTVIKTTKALNQIKKSVRGASIAILGLSYKGGVEDTRESPAFPIIKELKELGAKITIYDPYILNKSTVDSLDEALKKNDCIVIVTNHPEFKKNKCRKTKRT